MADLEKNELLDSDLFLALSSASSHVYVYVTDMKTGKSRWSKNFVEYFDAKSEYMDEVDSFWIPKIHPEDRETYIADIEKVKTGKCDHHCCEYRAINREGEYVWLECRGSLIRDEDGSMKLFAGMMTRLDNRSKYDSLTGLKTLYEFYKFDFSYGTGAVLLIGIDSFGDVIKNYGYGIGDEILSVFAKRLQECCEDYGKLYRMEGDKFIIILPEKSQEDLENLFAKIQEKTSRIVSSNGFPISISVSGGAAMYPTDGQKSGQVIVNMEYSLSQAKKYSRGKLWIYSSDSAKNLQKVIKQRQLLLQSVRDNMNYFEMYCQPIVTAKEHKVVSCEMLLRWFHPEVGPVNIEEVVKYLEYSGNIGYVGRWVMEQAFIKAKEWQQRFGDVSLSFNVSCLQFRDTQFVEDLIEMGRKYGVNTSLIHIELTESSKVDDFVEMSQNFAKLRAAGYRVSLDDFGIAYSTLLLLRNLPIDFVKIDHAFVRSLTKEDKVDMAIVESVISLCHNLNIGVVVEGIETDEVMQIIDQYPVTYLQGYHFSKPVAVKEYEKMILTTF